MQGGNATRRRVKSGEFRVEMWCVRDADTFYIVRYGRQIVIGKAPISGRFVGDAYMRPGRFSR